MGDTLDRSGRTKIGPEVALRGWDGSGVAATPRGRRRQSRDGSRPRYSFIKAWRAKIFAKIEWKDTSKNPTVILRESPPDQPVAVDEAPAFEGAAG